MIFSCHGNMVYHLTSFLEDRQFDKDSIELYLVQGIEEFMIQQSYRAD